jgi:hypothetical protein
LLLVTPAIKRKYSGGENNGTADKALTHSQNILEGLYRLVTASLQTHLQLLSDPLLQCATGHMFIAKQNVLVDNFACQQCIHDDQPIFKEQLFLLAAQVKAVLLRCGESVT